MKTMTYNALMNKVDNDEAQINAWATYPGGTYADVTFYTDITDDGTRMEVKVTGKPA